MKGILNDLEINKLIDDGCIIDGVNHQVRSSGSYKVVSYGVSSYGYDVRLSPKDVKLFANTMDQGIIDPKDFNPDNLVSLKKHNEGRGDYVILPPGGSALGSTVEYFKVPDDVMIICLGKSTYARSSVIINVTPIESGFHGTVVIELLNPSPLPVKIYLNEGIAQFVFFRGVEACMTSYSARSGKYQGQTGIQLPIV